MIDELETGPSVVNDIIAEERKKRIALAAKKNREKTAMTETGEPKKRRKRRWFKKPDDAELAEPAAEKPSKRAYKKRGPKPKGSASDPVFSRQEYDRFLALIDTDRDQKVAALKLLFGVQE